MNTYLLLFRGGSPEQTNLSPEAMQQHMQKWGAWIESLASAGHFKSGDPLDGGGKVLTGHDKILTDGPYAEAKDFVGGYVILTAESMDHAVKLSQGCPIFETNGAVEIRASTPMSTASA